MGIAIILNFLQFEQAYAVDPIDPTKWGLWVRASDGELMYSNQGVALPVAELGD